MEYYFRICNVVVGIKYNNTIIENYIERDFALLKCSKTDATIIIKIHDNITLPYQMRLKQSKQFVKVDGMLIHYFRAFNRHFWICYCQKGKILNIDLFIPYNSKETIKRVTSPFFETSLQSCILDFFHDPFLAVLQYRMLEDGKSLFHCSSFKILNSGGPSIILASGAQAGKSSLMGILSRKEKLNILTEDYAFVGANHVIYGYPHQTRVKFVDMKLLRIRYERKDEDRCVLLSFLDKINRVVYSLLTNNKNARHFSISEVYQDVDFIISDAITHEVYFLTRKTPEAYARELPLYDFCSRQTKIIMEELNNMTCAMDLLCLLGDMNNKDFSEPALRKKIFEIYVQAFKNVKCIELGVPYYSDIEHAANNLRNKLMQ